MAALILASAIFMILYVSNTKGTEAGILLGIILCLILNFFAFIVGLTVLVGS